MALAGVFGQAPIAEEKVHRRTDNFDVRLAIYLLPIPILILYGIALTAALPGLANVYLLEIQLHNPTQAKIRVGYFGTCITDPDEYTCRPSSSIPAEGPKTAQSVMIGNADAGQVLLYTTARTLQSSSLPCLLAPAGVLFALSLVPLLLLKRNLKKSNGTRAVKSRSLLRQTAYAASWSSMALTLAATLAVQQSTSALQYMTSSDFGGRMNITAGVVLPALQWAIVGLSLLYAVGVTSIFRKAGGTIRSAGSATAASNLGPSMAGSGVGTSIGGLPSYAAPLPIV